MMQTQALVVLLEGNEAVVESMASGGCGQCSSANGCNSGKMSQLFSVSRQMKVRNDVGAAVGDVVQVSLPDGMVLNSALLMYLLPLVLMFSGALLGMQLTADAAYAELYSALGGAAGLIIGFIAARQMSAGGWGFRFMQPVITRNVAD